MSKPGLTDADWRKINNMARYGTEGYTWSTNAQRPTPTPDNETCEWCGEPTPEGYCQDCAAEEFLHRCWANP